MGRGKVDDALAAEAKDTLFRFLSQTSGLFLVELYTERATVAARAAIAELSMGVAHAHGAFVIALFSLKRVATFHGRTYPKR